MKIDPTTLDIQTLAPLFAAFEESGARLLYVGGCIRNAVRGVAATDIDLSTDATPDQMRRIAQTRGIWAVDTGADHGTLTFFLGGHAMRRVVSNPRGTPRHQDRFCHPVIPKFLR